MTDMRRYLNILNEGHAPSRKIVSESALVDQIVSLADALNEGQGRFSKKKMAAIAAALGAAAAGIQGMADDGGYTAWGDDGTYMPEVSGEDDKAVWPVDFEAAKQGINEAATLMGEILEEARRGRGGRISKGKLAAIAAAIGAAAAALNGMGDDGGSGEEEELMSPGYEYVEPGYSPTFEPYPDENALRYSDDYED